MTGRESYDPATDERLTFDPVARAKKPSVYEYGDATTLGNFLEAYGQIIKNLNCRDGQRVLEYGPGDGQLSINLARMGCEVTVIDIEPRYLEAIQIQSGWYDVRISAIEGSFSTVPDGRFERVIFFETFHHAIDHAALLGNVRNLLTDDGYVLFAGEPIIPSGDYWEPTLPYAWGPRLDGLSLRAMRAYGWMELGFRECYFNAALKKAGFAVQKIASQTNGRGTSYIARKNHL